MRPFVTVVTGVPRSGTSLMMQMLSAGGMPLLCDASRPADPDNPRGYFELEAVKRTWRDAGWVEAARGRAVKVVHLLVPALPPDRSYRVISLHRATGEVLASQRAMLLRRGEPAETGPAEARLGAVLEAQLEAAERWAEAAPDTALLRVDHAALLSAPRDAAARVAAFLGGGLDVAAMAERVDPSLHRQRSPGERG